MAHMLPTLREKKRYLVYKVVSEETVSRADAETAIKQVLKQFMGDLGMAKAGVMFLKDWKESKGIMKISHKETDTVKAGLALVKEINGKKAIVKSVGLSGILDKARSKYL